MTARRRQHRFDLSFGPGHGPVSGVLNAAAAMYALTMWLYVGHGSAWWGLTAGITMAAAGVTVARVYDQPLNVQQFRAACWGGAGFWSGWTLSGFNGIPLPFTDFRLLTMFSSPGNPWTWKPFYGMLVGAAVTAMIGWRMVEEHRKREAAAERKAAEEAAALAAAAELALRNRMPLHEEEGIAFEWQPILDRIITRRKLLILGVEKWEPFYGFTLDVQLPDDGTVLKDIKGYEEALASAADLPDGCGVEIVGNPGLGRRNILIKVTTETALAADIPYPNDATPDTIENPQAIGVRAEGANLEIDQRYACVTLVGQTDSGKSNQLNTVIRSNARCTDAIKVGIDLSGQGRIFRPWIRAYAEGRAERPIFAQVAHTEHRARLLAKSLLNIVNGRTADYAELMFKEGTDKIMPRPSLPQIILYVDEFGTLPGDVKDIVATLAETGRGAAVRVVSCALEATAMYLPNSIVRQSRVRIAMRVSDEAQLQYLFDATWSRGRFDPASMPWKGSGLVAEGPVTPSKFKGYRMDPARIDQDSVLLAPLQPDLDELSLQRADTVTVSVMGDLGREDVTFTGVWTNAEAETYPEIFPGKNLAVMGAGGANATGGATATLEKEKPVNSNPNPGTAADAARAMNDSVGGMMDALDKLEKEADQAEKDHKAAKDKAAAEAGDGDPSSSAAAPSAAELSAWFDLPAAKKTPPDLGPPSATPTPPTFANPQGQPHPRRRAMQIIVEHKDKGGIGPTEITEILTREGFTTDRATVSGWLKRFKLSGKVVQPDGDRTPYLPGPEAGDPYQL